MTHGSLFSGIGGFDLAAREVGFENIFQVERDKWCQKVLTKNFPETKKYLDIKEFNGKEYEGSIDIISGGFPCQPFSFAGKRKSKNDDRYLWPEMLRVIREVKPPFIVCENVTGIITLALDDVLASLENEGYTTETFIIPACSIGAWHRRERVWIIAYTDIKQRKRKKRRVESEFINGGQDAANNDSKRFKTKRERIGHNGEEERERIWTPIINHCWSSEPGMGRVANGLPGRVDRLKGLGNAIVPQIAKVIFESIKEFENNNHL